MKRLKGLKIRRQKRDGLKWPKTPSQTHGQTHSQASLNAQKNHFQRGFLWRLKKTGMGNMDRQI